MEKKTHQIAKDSYCREQENITAAAIEQLDRIQEVAEERDDLKKQLAWSQEELERLRAKELYCREQENIDAAAIEQLNSIKKVAEERDNLRKKLECSQEELKRLRKNVEEKKVYTVQTLSRGDAETDPSSSSQYPGFTSTDNEIKQLEQNIEQMRHQDITAELEVKIIRKEVEVMKKYCSKLSIIQKENNDLKEQIFFYEDSFAKLGCSPATPDSIEELKLKIETSNNALCENEALKVKVRDLDKELCSHTYSPKDVEVFRQRSLLLEEVLVDRARLSQKVEQLRSLDQEVHDLKKKASRADELEDYVMKMNREKNLVETEVNQLKRKLSVAEAEEFNRKAEGDILRSKVVCMEHEIASLKSFCEDKERLRVERDHLKTSMEEMMRAQGDVEYMKKQIQCLEVLKAERDIFKSNYENLIGLECECDILRAQLERAKDVEKERNSLEFRVEDLESCIADQENEIKRLVCHIDTLAKGRDEEQEKFRELVVQMRAEIEKKDVLISATQEKLSSVESRLENSIHGLSSQTFKHKNKTSKLESVIRTLNLELDRLKSKNDELEDSVNSVQVENQKLIQSIMDLKKENDNLTKHLKDLTEDNVFLIKILEEKEDSLNTLSEVLKDHEPILDEFERSQTHRVESSRDMQTETDPICLITSELEITKEENRRLHEKVTKISNLATDPQLQELLLHSKSAIRRISLELNKQCDEWHTLQNQIQVFRSKDEAPHTIETPEKLIVNYCISTGINTDVEKRDCIKTKRRADVKELCESTNTNITVSKIDEEVQSSSFIMSMPSTSKSDAGTITKGTEIVSVGVDSPSTSKLEDERRISTIEVSGGKEHAITQKPEKVIYASKTRARSEAIQLEYNISRWNFLEERVTPPTLISRSVTSHDSNNYSATKQIIYSRVTSVSCNTVTKTQENVVIVPSQTSDNVSAPRIEVCNAACQKSPKLVTVATKTDTISSKDEEVETFETARSSLCSRCKSLEERLQILEKELLTSNDIMLRLKDEVCKGTKITAENEALRKHSAEVQEVAIDQIQDLIEYVKRIQEKATTLQDENEKLNTCNCSLQLEIRQLSELIQDVQKLNDELLARNAAMEIELKDDSEVTKLRGELQKAVSDNDDLEKLLLGNMVKNTKLEKEVESLVEQNKYLKEEIDRLEVTENESEMLNSKLTNSEGRVEELENRLGDAIEENKRLIKELNTVKMQLRQQPYIDINEINDLRKQNENLLKKIKAQTSETNELLDKLRTPHVDVPSLPSDVGDEGVLVTICQDLENQLKNLEKAGIPNEVADDLQRLVEDLCKRLEESEHRAKEAEALLRTLKVNDPSAMLSDELNKCRAKIAQLELKNESLIKAREDLDHLKAELASCRGDYRRSLEDKEALQQLIGKLKTDNIKLTAALAEMSVDDYLKEEIMRLKYQMGQLETENAGLKHKSAEHGRSFDKIDYLQQTIRMSKQELLKAENEIDRLRKELESSNTNRKASGDKVDELEKERTKNLATIHNLEKENAGLKKELESILTTAKHSSIGTSDLQSEIAKLKLIIGQLEGDKIKLKKDFDNAVESLKIANDKLQQKTEENENLSKCTAASGDQISRLKTEVEKANTAAQSAAAAKKELENKLEIENTKLQLASKAGERISELENLVATLRQQISALEVIKTKLQKDLEKSKLALAKDNAPAVPKHQLPKLELENARLNDELNAALDNFNKINATILENQKENKILKQKLALFESENAQLKKQVDNILEESRTSSSELKRLKSGESTLKQRLAMLESENVKVKKDLDLISKDNKNYISQIQSLKQNNSKREKENEQLKQSLETVIRDITPKDESAVWKQKALQTEEALNKLKTELAAMLDEHKTCPKTISQLNEENDRLKTKLSDLENENNKLKNQYEGAMGDSLKNVSELEKLKGSESKLKALVSKLELGNKKLQNEITVFRSELGNTDLQLNKSKEDIANLKQKNAYLETTNIKLKNDIDETLSEKDKLQKSLCQLKNDNSILNGIIVQLENENTELEKELENIAASPSKDLTDSTEKFKEQIAALNNRNQELIMEINNLLNEARESENAKEEQIKSKQQLSNLQNEYNKLKIDLDNALKDAVEGNTSLFQFKDENARLKQRLSQLEDETFHLKKDLDNALDQVKKGAAEQDSDIKVKQRLVQLEDEREKLKKNLEKTIKDSKSKINIAEDLRNENVKQKQLVSQLQIEILKLQNIIDTQQRADEETKEANELKDKIKQLEQENTSLKSNLEGMYGDAKNKVDDYSKLLDENGKLNEKLLTLQNEIDSLNKELSDSEKEKKALNGKIGKLKEREIALSKQLGEGEATKSRSKRSLEGSVESIRTSNKRSEENINLRLNLTRAENEIKRLKNHIDETMNDAKKKVNEINKLKDEILKLRAKIVELEKTNAILKSDLDYSISQNGKLKKDQGDNKASIKELKEAHDKDIKNLTKKNEENVAQLKKQHQSTIEELKIKHDKESKSLQETLTKLTNERDKLKKLLDEQKKKTLGIKDKVEQVEDVIFKERKMSKQQIQKFRLLAEKLDEQSRMIEKYRKKSQELKEENDNLIKKAAKAEDERESIEKSNLALKESFRRDIKSNEDIKNEVEVLRKKLADKKEKLTVKTFNTVSVPDVVAIPVLSEKELKFFGKKACVTKPNLQAVINKMATDGIQSLLIEELQFLQNKLCDATADQLSKMGQSAGVLKPNESGDKIGLLRRIAILEEELSEKQKIAEHKVNAMQYAVKIGKTRVSDLQKSLEQERKLSSELIVQVDSHSKMVIDLKQEKESIDRQKTYHERKLEEYIVTIEKERAKTRNLEDELEKEKTNVLHFKSLLEAERDRARIHKRKDTEALERMRVQLEKTVNSEILLKMKLQDKIQQRSDSPCKPVKDTHPVTKKSRPVLRAASSSSEFSSLSDRRAQDD